MEWDCDGWISEAVRSENNWKPQQWSLVWSNRTARCQQIIYEATPPPHQHNCSPANIKITLTFTNHNKHHTKPLHHHLWCGQTALWVRRGPTIIISSPPAVAVQHHNQICISQLNTELTDQRWVYLSLYSVSWGSVTHNACTTSTTLPSPHSFITTPSSRRIIKTHWDGKQQTRSVLFVPFSYPWIFFYSQVL